MRPCVRSATLDGYVGLARSLGLDPVQLLGEVGLDAADLAVPDRWIPAAACARLLERSAVLSGKEDFGLRLAELRRLATLGPLSVVLREEPHLRSALQLLARYEHSYNEALHLELTEANGVATVRTWLELREPAPTRQALELAVAALLGIIRELLGRTWEPLAVCLPHRRPARLDAYVRVFGPRVQFGQAFAGLLLYSGELDRRNPASDPLLRPYTRRFLESIPAPRSGALSDRVRRVVEVLLPVGRCSIQQVARGLGMSDRTLQRQLEAEQESFSAIVNRTRAGLTERYLANDRLSLTEISDLLGFAAPSGFSRWFRQQFGVSPSQWRASAAADRS